MIREIERILGDSEFVDSVLSQAAEKNMSATTN